MHEKSMICSSTWAIPAAKPEMKISSLVFGPQFARCTWLRHSRQFLYVPKTTEDVKDIVVIGKDMPLKKPWALGHKEFENK